ncbi:hypothetical protein CBR_g28901 [Chara braunii]|uniref:Integrase catalytic domain-containing protein n=1 Tax=Chara braunii TaxID=69332 RepID=A0A388LA39_CHABU|nr:hypothetical protein CBR_g28901 [Chara braunii]|eukprot:GBG79185.1 hypothetical protein CBR_g28901 [Chara braunii]
MANSAVYLGIVMSDALLNGTQIEAIMQKVVNRMAYCAKRLQAGDDEFEEGEIKEAFCAEEHDGIYLELGLLLSCEMRDRNASAKAQKVRHLYVVRDDHLFIKRQVGNPKRIVCGRNRQIDIIASLHDGIAGGHRGIGATCAKISELYHWDGMLAMVIKYCQSCVPCQERSTQRPGEPLHPRLEKEVDAVVHLDLLFMPVGENGCNYIFNARDNLTGFVDGRAIRTKTGPVLGSCIEEHYLRYPFVKEFVMDRGSEFTCNEVRTLLAGYGVVANYTTAAHPQANAPVERGHSTITNLLAKWTEGKPGQWPKFLRAVFFVENVIVKRTTKYAPAILWGAAGRRGYYRQRRYPSSYPDSGADAAYWPEGIPEPDSEEMPVPSSGTATPPPKQAEPEEREGSEEVRAHMIVTLQPAGHVAEPMDTEAPTLEEPPPELPSAEEGVSAGAPVRGAHKAQAERPLREAAEEKLARVQVRLEEIYLEKVRMEAAGEAPAPRVDPGTNKRARQSATTSFQRYTMLSDELAASRSEVEQLSTQLVEERAENQAWRSRMEAKEAEWEKRLQDMATIVEGLSATKVVDWTKQSRYGIQGKEVQGLFAQGGTAEPSQREGMKKVFLDPAEVEARRKANEGSFSFRAPTELASQQATPMAGETPTEEPAQRSQPPLTEGGPTEESPTIILEVQEGTLTGAAASTEPEGRRHLVWMN